MDDSLSSASLFVGEEDLDLSVERLVFSNRGFDTSSGALVGLYTDNDCANSMSSTLFNTSSIRVLVLVDCTTMASILSMVRC